MLIESVNEKIPRRCHRGPVVQRRAEQHLRHRPGILDDGLERPQPHRVGGVRRGSEIILRLAGPAQDPVTVHGAYGRNPTVSLRDASQRPFVAFSVGVG